MCARSPYPLDFSVKLRAIAESLRCTGEITINTRRFVAVVVVAIVGRKLWIGTGRRPAHHHVDAGAARPIGRQRVGLDRHLRPRPGHHPQGMVSGDSRGDPIGPQPLRRHLRVDLDPHPGDGHADVAGAGRTRHRVARAARDRGRPVRRHARGRHAADLLRRPRQWLQGDRSARIPGSVDGNEFDARFSEAVQRIYDSGEQNPSRFRTARRSCSGC